jgi:hypothetical protein
MRVVLATTVRLVMDFLVREDYHGLEALTGGLRLDAREIEQAISDYGRTLTLPPPEAYDLLDVVRVVTAIPETWSVNMDIWTVEEGRSDLTIEMTIVLRDEEPTVELDGIHVL